MIRRFSLAASLALALISTVMPAAGAVPAASVAAPSAVPSAVPSYISENLPEARLAGEGGYSWFGLQLYQAQLWVGPAGYQSAMPETAPFVLELRYARNLDGQKIAEASYEQMQKIKAGSEQQRLAWRDTMLRIFPDVKQGQRIAAAWRAGVAPGMRFYLDGKVMADVPDSDFARAFFAIWFSPATTAPQLRAALLRDAQPLAAPPP